MLRCPNDHDEHDDQHINIQNIMNDKDEKGIYTDIYTDIYTGNYKDSLTLYEPI